MTISYRGIVYFPAWSTYHIFDMDLRIHLTGSEEIELPERLVYEDIAATIHAHPTISEIMLEASQKALGRAVHG